MIKLQLELKVLYQLLQILPAPVEISNNTSWWPCQNKINFTINGTIISTSFILPSAEAFPVIFILHLNDLKFTKLLFGSSL